MAWLSLFLFMVMCAIIFFQWMQGLFSALIMAVLCVLSATAALGAHEMLAESILNDLIGDYGYAVAFIGIFGLSLLGTRLLLDKVVARDTQLPGLIDKAGALAFGIITGLICAGALGIGIQMLPTGPSILGFRRYDEQGQPQHKLWLNPDAFTVKLCGYLADTTLGGPDSWLATHPDFLTELHWLRDTESGGSRRTAGPHSVSITAEAWDTQVLFKFKRAVTRRGVDSFEPNTDLPPGKRWLGISTMITKDGADADGRFRFSGSQVRLVGETAKGITQQYTLKAVGPYGNIHVLTDSEPLWGTKSGQHDFIFEVPEDFRPRFLEFKRGARVLMPHKFASDLAEMESRTPSSSVVLSSPSEASARSGSRRGRSSRDKTTPVRPLKKDTHFGEDLPMTIERYAGSAMDAGGEVLRSGQLALYVDHQGDPKSGSNQGGFDPKHTPLKSFLVPDGLRLLQLNVEALHANTALAGALNLTRRVLQQYRVIDTLNQDYWPAGVIAECDSGGERVMEIQYFPEHAELHRAIRPFQRIKFNDLTGDYRFVLLFLMPKGTEIVSFDSGRKPVDLSDLNLVAGD